MGRAEYCDDCKKLIDDRDGSCDCDNYALPPVMEQIQSARIENLQRQLASAKAEIMALKADTEHYLDELEGYKDSYKVFTERYSKVVNRNLYLENFLKEVIEKEGCCCFDVNNFCVKCAAEEVMEGEIKDGKEDN